MRKLLFLFLFVSTKVLSYDLVKIDEWLGQFADTPPPYCDMKIGKTYSVDKCLGYKVVRKYSDTNKLEITVSDSFVSTWVGLPNELLLKLSNADGVYILAAKVSPSNFCPDGGQLVNFECVGVDKCSAGNNDEFLEWTQKPTEFCNNINGDTVFSCNYNSGTGESVYSGRCEFMCNDIKESCSVWDIENNMCDISCLQAPDPETPDPENPDNGELLAELKTFHNDNNKNLSDILNAFNENNSDSNFESLIENDNTISENLINSNSDNTSDIISALDTNNKSLSDTVTDNLDSLSTSITDTFNGVGDGLSNTFNGVGDNIIDGLHGVGNLLNNSINGIGDNIGENLGTNINPESSGYSGLYTESDLAGLESDISKIKGDIESKFGEFKTLFNFNPNSIGSGDYVDHSFSLNIAGQEIKVSSFALDSMIEKAPFISALIYFIFGFLGIRVIIGGN